MPTDHVGPLLNVGGAVEVEVEGEEEVVVVVAVVVVVVVAEDGCIREPQSIRGILLRDIQSTKRPKKTKRINSRPKTKPKRKSTSNVPAWRGQPAEQPKA